MEQKLFALEEKWISNQISRETYDCWSSNYNNEIFSLKASIERFGRDLSEGYKLLGKHLNALIDMKYIYNQVDTLGERQLMSVVFDSNLYYEMASIEHQP